MRKRICMVVPNSMVKGGIAAVVNGYRGSRLEKDYKIAPMSEEIVLVGGKTYVMCESASDKSIFGKLTSANFCYATDLEKIKK